MATHLSHSMNIAGKMLKHPSTPDEFMLEFWPQSSQATEPMTPDATADTLMAMLGGTTQKPVA